MVNAWVSVVTLPIQLPMLLSALGMKFEGRVDSGRFKLLLPLAGYGPFQAAQPLLAPLESPFVRAHGGNLGTWGHIDNVLPSPSSEPAIGRILKVVLEIDAESNAPKKVSDFAMTFGKEFNEWFDTAVSWIELWNHLNLTNLRESYPGTTGTVGAQDGSGAASGWSPVDRIYVTTAAHAINGETLTYAFEKATAVEHPPTEWLLYLQGAKTSDDRLAIIEAATAAEVALTGAIHRRLLLLSVEAREEVVLNANGLYGMVKLLQKLDAKRDTTTLDKVGKKLANPRNNAVHAGRQPMKDEVQDAFVIARELLENYSPLPAASKGEQPTMTSSDGDLE